MFDLALTPTPPSPLPVAIVWHQHQPQYPKVPGTEVFEQPWVRLHGAKDYWDMAAIAREFPGLKLTINLTPVLLKQLDAYNHGATDRHAQLALRPADQLTAGERDECRRRFFQVSGPMLASWPRLAELKDKAAPAWTAEDYRDAAALFHLAWTDPDLLARPPLAALAAKGRGYSEADKRLVLAEHRRILREIVPLHRQLQDEGRIEVTTTPFYHPILPLIHDSALAREALPDTPMPTGRFRRPEDARFHAQEAVRYYRALFARPPRGMWPGEGSVAQDVAPLFKEAGIRWIATDEDVLARSRGLKLRDGELLTAAGGQALYRAYQLTDGPAIVFRDRKLSDDIGFRYGKLSGEAAAADLLAHLGAIARTPGTQPRLVSIILDGENAWENYPDDGKAFLRALYRGLTTDPRFVTVTPAEHLERHRPVPLGRLWAGSWIGASFATWIGEEEENRAWDLLFRAREAVAAFGARNGERNAGYRNALNKLYAAEGSDWFWWYGQDQDSGRDEEFDEAFRRLLAAAWRDLGRTPPGELATPIVQVGATPARKPTRYLAPTINGPMDRTEWAHAGSVFAEGGAMSTGGRAFDAVFYGWDKRNLYLAVQHARDLPQLTALLRLPAGRKAPRAAAHVRGAAGGSLEFPGTALPSLPITAGRAPDTTELAIPWSALGLRSGDAFTLTLHAPGRPAFPAQPLKLVVPVLAARPLVTLVDAPDPPGASLPTGGAYTRAAIDMRALEVAEEGDAWAFTWKLGEVRDPWGSPIGLSLVTLDLYMAPRVFVEGRRPMPVPLLDARGAKAERPWSHALSIEGWQQALFTPDGEKRAEIAVAVDPLTAEVRAIVPKRTLPRDPRQMAFLAVLAAQDGFSPGRIRPIMPAAEPERFGGRPSGRGSNLLDVLLPAGQGEQAALLAPPDGDVVLPYVSVDM